MSLLQDVRYSARGLHRNPNLAAVVVLTLALGIGATTSIFTLINAMLLTPLPVHDPQQLVLLGSGSGCCVNSGIPQTFQLLAYQQYLQLRDNNPYFSGLAAVRAEKDPVRIRLSGSTEPASLENARLVSANYFEVIGSTPVYGRGFGASEDVGQGAHPVVVVSDHWASQRFSRPSAAVGQSIIINNTPFTIVGVAAPGFFGERLEPDPADLWVPLSMQPQITTRASFLNLADTVWLYGFGRLKPGVNPNEAAAWTKAQIQAYLASSQGTAITEEDRKDIAAMNFQFTPGQYGTSGIGNGNADFLHLLMAVVLVLLLICCCNIANLLLARAVARRHEIVTRIAVGASRWRLIRQVITESLILGMLGGLAGYVLATFFARLFVAMQFRDSYVPLKLAPDARILGFTVGLSVLSTLAFGLVPAFHAARTSFVSRSNASFVETGTKRFSLGSLLVVSQVSFSLVLVIVAGLFARTLAKLSAVPLGFDTRVIDARIDPGKSGYTPARLEALYARLTDRLNSLPGVQSATLAQYAPFSGDNWGGTFQIPGTNNNQSVQSRWLRVNPNFATTLGMRVIAGRDIVESDHRRNVALVNEAFAKQYLQGVNPLGRPVRFNDTTAVPWEIVGVVSNGRFKVNNEDESPTLYVPLVDGSAETNSAWLSSDSIYAHDVLVRVAGDPAAAIQSVRRAILEVAPEMAIQRVGTLREQVDRSFNFYDTLRNLSVSFGVVGLLIACVGLYGVLMYGVVRRTREIGVRLALGAVASDVVRMILRQSLWLVGWGISAGLPLAWVASRLSSSMLFGVSAMDPLVCLASVLVLCTVASIAAFLPARSASRTDPALILRAE